MKAYWDASALVETVSNRDLEARLVAQGGYTRTHTLTEVLSALTGKMHIRMDAKDAAKAVRAMAGYMQFVNLSEEEVLNGLDAAQAVGVRGRTGPRLHPCAGGGQGKSGRAVDDGPE